MGGATADGLCAEIGAASADPATFAVAANPRPVTATRAQVFDNRSDEADLSVSKTVTEI